MKHRYLLITLCATTMIYPQSYEWVVIGAGPAGIATVGLLLDSGVSKDTLLWIDPTFNVGRLGTYYSNVPGNSKAHTYHYYLQNCSEFQKVQTPAITELMQHDPTTEPILGAIVAPLIDITTHLLQLVPYKKEMVTGLLWENDQWDIQLTDNRVNSSNVILATGCHPYTLDYSGPQVIGLDQALDKERLSTLVTKDDTVAVVGSAHSAALILMYLHEMGIPTVHLYKHSFKYKYDMGKDNPTTIVGLQGVAAQWAYYVYEQALPETITPALNTHENRDRLLPQCTKIIYAVGYVRNTIDGWNFDLLEYDNQTGTIAPHLFGIGLAFPEEVCDYDGTKNYAIGLIDFMKYGQRIVPQWVNQHTSRCSRTSLDKPFIITQL